MKDTFTNEHKFFMILDGTLGIAAILLCFFLSNTTSRIFMLVLGLVSLLKMLYNAKKYRHS